MTSWTVARRTCSTLLRVHGHHHRRGGARGLPMSVTVSLALAMRKMTRANSPGPATGRLRDDRLGDGHLLRQDRHADAEQDAGRRASGCDGQAFDRGTPTGSADARRPAGWADAPARLARPQRRRQLDREPGREGRQAGRRSATRPRAPCCSGCARRASTTSNCAPQFPPLYQIHFSSERKRMTTVVRSRRPAGRAGQGRAGSGRSTAVHALPRRRRHGPRPGRPRRGSAVRDDLRDAAGAGDAHAGLRLRRAAAGHARTTRTRCTTRATELESGLVFAGFVAIRDPLRDDVKEAVARVPRGRASR